MSEFVSNNLRRRHSTDTLTLSDIPAPPYGLTDAAYRRGSIMMPEPPPSNKMYRMRLNTLEIRSLHRYTRSSMFSTRSSKFTVQDCPPIHPQLHPSQATTVSAFEAVIRTGHPLFLLLRGLSRSNLSQKPDMAMLHDRLLAIWKLCGSVGARLCEADARPHETMLGVLGNIARCVSDIMERVRYQAEQLGFRDGELVEGEEVSATSEERWRVFNRSVAKINMEYGVKIDQETRYLLDHSFGLQMESFEG